MKKAKAVTCVNNKSFATISCKVLQDLLSKWFDLIPEMLERNFGMKNNIITYSNNINFTYLQCDIKYKNSFEFV